MVVLVGFINDLYGLSNAVCKCYSVLNIILYGLVIKQCSHYSSHTRLLRFRKAWWCSECNSMVAVQTLNSRTTGKPYITAN